MRLSLEKIPKAHRLLLRKFRTRLGYPYRGVWRGRGASRGSRLCLFAHWDRHGVVDDYILNYLERIADHGFAIDFVTTSNDLEAASLRRVRKLCRWAFLRLNKGLDFASWKAAVPDPSTFQDYEVLLLANDSVFGPFHDLGPILDQMATQPASLCGLTDNYEVAHHVQSYFLYIPQPTLFSPTFTTLWTDIEPIEDKGQIIERYEVGTSQRILQSGGTLKAVFSYEAIAPALRAMGTRYQYHEDLKTKPLNLMLLAWDVLLEEFGFPFVKTELLKTNYWKSTRVPQWRDLVLQESRHLIPMIERHLQRVAPHGPGLTRGLVQSMA